MDNECILIFFFQAEDGIRDGHVTGVQTCALPISDRVFGIIQQHDQPLLWKHAHNYRAKTIDSAVMLNYRDGELSRRRERRSEERRVGKEWRAWWGGDE